MLKQILNKIQISLPGKKQSNREAPHCIRAEASYLAEAAVAVPFFVGAMVVCLFFFRVLQVEAEVSNALMQAGRELAVASFQESGRLEGPLAARQKVLSGLSADSVSGQFIHGGRMGISLLQSDFSGNYILLQADYRIRLPIGLFGRIDFPVTQRVKCRKWTGASDDDGGEEESFVYITPTGTAYHSTKECRYLRLSIRQIPYNQAENRRSENGSRYYACNRCMKNENPYSMVYITSYGNRYHGKIDCSGLKRTIFAVRLSEVGTRHACSGCR